MFPMPRAAIAGVLLFCAPACDRPATTRPAPGPATAPAVARPTVASLVPACSDLLLAMGAADHLVAVSNYDTANPQAAALPRVGDYLNTDWEKLAALKPDLIVIQMKPDAVPQGLRERAATLGARLLNVEIETLADIRRTAIALGQAVDEPAKAASFVTTFDARLTAVRDSVKDLPRVRTLITLDEGGQGVVGPGGFLDEVLHLAGGENAAASLGRRYATVDRERLLALNPQVILQLLPGHPRADLTNARRAWDSLPGIDAVKSGRIHTFTDWYMLTPGPHLADVAERFAQALHPEAFGPAAGATTRTVR